MEEIVTEKVPHAHVYTRMPRSIAHAEWMLPTLTSSECIINMQFSVGIAHRGSNDQNMYV